MCKYFLNLKYQDFFTKLQKWEVILNNKPAPTHEKVDCCLQCMTAWLWKWTDSKNTSFFLSEREDPHTGWGLKQFILLYGTALIK